MNAKASLKYAIMTATSKKFINNSSMTEATLSLTILRWQQQVCHQSRIHQQFIKDSS